MTRTNDTTATSGPLLLTALATVFCSSAAIMLLQLVSGRLVAAYLGQSLYTWTSAIGVTLAGIAIGNTIGGRLADRSAGTRTLGIQILVAAGCVLSVLALNPIAGALPPLVALPWPARIFLHTALVFLVPFTALGTISPVIAKLALAAGGPSGRRIGSVFAWSITGSLVGVFLTGYLLLALAGNRAILVCSALVLAVLGVALLASGRKFTAAAEQNQSNEKPQSIDLKLILIAAFAGALVMMVELTAARMLSRIYGNSLFTWTTDIGVILAAMALGGPLGGRLADRFGAMRALTGLLVGASASCAALPLLHNILYRFPILWDLPWPVQIFAHTLFVFFLPCLLLGAAPPAVVRHAVEANPNAGRAVGVLYAWNSLGSIAGAFLTGYVLIAALGTVQVICLTFLVSAALALFATPKSTAAQVWAMVAVVLGLAAFVPFPPFNAVGLNLALRPYRAPETIFERESQYSYIAVNEVDPENEPGVRTLVLDKLVHNKTDIDHPLELKYPYLQFYAAALNVLYPPVAPLDVLAIGGGGYNFIDYLEKTRPGGHTVAIEIDPEVTEAAHAAFGFPRDTKAEIHHMDGRNFVDQEAARSSKKFDTILGDCVNDYSVPFPLTTVEFVQNIARLLKDDGVYMLNMMDQLDSGQFLAAVVGTCEKVFPNVYVFSPTGRGDARDTFVVLASKRPVDLRAAVDGVNMQSHEAGRILGSDEVAALKSRAKLTLLTDDFAPVENLLAPVVLRTEESTLFRRLVRADRFMEQGRPDKAIQEAEIIVARSKNFPEASELLANAYEQQRDPVRALTVLRDLVDAHPANLEYREKLAVHLFRAGHPQEAEQTFQEVLRKDPGYAQAHLDFGAALLQMNRLDEAEPHLRTAVAALPPSDAAHINLMALLAARGDLAAAVNVLKEAVAKRPESERLQQQLAIIATKAKDYDVAWGAVHAAQKLGAALPEGLVTDLQRLSGRKE